jgi:hypothetical protein
MSTPATSSGWASHWSWLPTCSLRRSLNSRRNPRRSALFLSSNLAARVAGSDGVQLDQLGRRHWVGFPRSSSPAWYDELTGILRSHGVDVGPPAPDDQELIAAVKFAAVKRWTSIRARTRDGAATAARQPDMVTVGGQARGAPYLGGVGGRVATARRWVPDCVVLSTAGHLTESKRPPSRLAPSAV